MRKYVMVLAVAVAAMALMVGSGGAVARPAPHLRKACSAYSKEHFHGVTAQLPDGTKCLEPGEYCSHDPGYPSAYREYGFKCKPDGRLEEV